MKLRIVLSDKQRKQKRSWLVNNFADYEAGKVDNSPEARGPEGN